ncbi:MULTISPECIES: AraC family transcriptional regulator [unclassified Paenibacillus]|uniref:AraC family transcriptional regulator n=1 Tax=unclassified Paenibacillus TaxID=185978 RepID=UPI00363CAD34
MGKHGVDIRWTSRYDYEQGGRLNPHEHDFFQIIYFIDGKGTFTLAEAEYVISPGVFIFINPMLKHGFIPYGNSKIKTLDLKFDISDKDILEMASGLQAYQTDDSMVIKDLLEKIRFEGLNKRLFYGEMACLSLIQILYTLFRQNGEPPKQKNVTQAVYKLKNEPIEAAQRLEHYIQEHYAEELSLGAISAQLCYSSNYLSQIFKINYGCTFTNYLRRIRIERSKELISYSALSLKQIAESVGFKTIYHFSRVFKETEGINPGKWKVRELEGIRKDVHFN